MTLFLVMLAVVVCGVVGAVAYDRALYGVRFHPEPTWIVLLRQALIRAMPTCTLWAVDLYQDRVHLRFWPRWGVYRRDIEDCPGLRPRALFAMQVNDGGNMHQDATLLVAGLLLGVAGVLATALLWAFT